MTHSPIRPALLNGETRILRKLALAFAATALVALAGCAGKPDQMKTASIPDDYRTRHPISIAEVEHGLDIPVASGDRSFSIGARDVVAGFVSDYKSQSSGMIRVDYPKGAPNSAAAQRLRGEIRETIRTAGIPGARIIETSYQADPAAGPAPIRLTYVAMTAMTDGCGEWPEDLADNTIENKNWSNFGCATQQNLAAQIANPMDLVAPRVMTPIDARRRTNVISVYRTGSASNSGN